MSEKKILMPIFFINELFDASKLLGVLEAKISDYQFNQILIPMFRNKEAISSMMIEGTETTITDVLEYNIHPFVDGNGCVGSDKRTGKTLPG